MRRITQNQEQENHRSDSYKFSSPFFLHRNFFVVHWEEKVCLFTHKSLMCFRQLVYESKILPRFSGQMRQARFWFSTRRCGLFCLVGVQINASEQNVWILEEGTEKNSAILLYQIKERHDI